MVSCEEMELGKSKHSKYAVRFVPVQCELFTVADEMGREGYDKFGTTEAVELPEMGSATSEVTLAVISKGLVLTGAVYT